MSFGLRLWFKFYHLAFSGLKAAKTQIYVIWWSYVLEADASRGGMRQVAPHTNTTRQTGRITPFLEKKSNYKKWKF